MRICADIYLGVEAAGGLMHHLVKRGSTLPTKKSQVFTTVGDDQDVVIVKIFRGERALTSDNYFMGRLPPLPIQRGKAGEAKVWF